MEHDLGWVNLGKQAFGLTRGDQLVAVLYWTPADVGELGDVGGEPVVTDAGFFLVDTDSASTHFQIADGEDDAASWGQARELAAHQFMKAHGYDTGED